jgi:diguanylate cyclase (GGDEF)-like protein
MRLITITNWAYGATVVLTLVSGTTMLLASSAQERERSAVAQRYQLDQATSGLDAEIFVMTERAREYVATGDPTQRDLYRTEAARLGSIERRIRQIGDAGASPAELNALAEAVRWADALQAQQRLAIAAHDGGNDARARQILFGPEYERELDRVVAQVERFQDRLDRRTETEIAEAEGLARLWRTTSEIVLAITGLLFLAVLLFIFKQRVLRPVVSLSDVVTRLAAQDYAAEPPDYGQFDEIGDMSQAIRIFRENGIERQRLEEERDRDRTMRDLISRMTQRLQGCDTLTDLEDVLQRFVPEIAPGLAGRLYLLDEARNVMAAACDWLSPVHSRAEFSVMGCWALRRGTAHRPAGERIDVPCDHIDDGAAVDTICLPLIAQRQTHGLLYFEPRPGRGDTVQVTSDTYLDILAENVGLALGNLRLRDKLRDMALADPLTGLANRRHLDAVLDLHLAEAERQQRPIGCIMLDVDHFKHFNDDFGHDAGDWVLRAVGSLLANATRESGLAFRHGGEEFLLLLPGFDVDQSARRAEEIRARIAALDLRHDGVSLGPVTASLGVASAPDRCAFDQMVRAADSALLRAKEAGRDRVVVAEPRRNAQAA